MAVVRTAGLLTFIKLMLEIKDGKNTSYIKPTIPTYILLVSLLLCWLSSMKSLLRRI